MAKRIKVPHKKEVEILFKNKHVCCICRELRSSSEVQIHHIDGDPSNNNLNNLAVLCSSHHNLANIGLQKGGVGQSKKFSSDEIRRYKNEWEKKVETETRIERRALPIHERKQLDILYKFEISKRKNEILAFSKREYHAIEDNYKFLKQLSLEEFVSGLKLRSIILDAYSDISFQCVWRDYVALPLVDAVRDLFPHLVGPQHVRIHSNDKKLLLKSLDIFKTVGGWGAEFSNNINLLIKVCQTIYELAEIASWYKFSGFLTKTIQVLNSIKKDCSEYEPDKKGVDREKSIKDREKIVKEVILSVNKLK